jgi:hypothetical protein
MRIQARRTAGGDRVDFVALVDQVIALLRQRGWVTYRTLQRQFQLDTDALTDLLGEPRYAHRNAIRAGNCKQVTNTEIKMVRSAPRSKGTRRWLPVLS